MDNFDFKKYLAKNPLLEAYTPGSGWTKDFDYDDMLAQGLKVSVDTPLEDLEKMFADFEDVNYHREGEHLSYAIDALKDGNKEEAEDYINKFRKEIKKTIADYSDEYFDVNEAQGDKFDVETTTKIAQKVADAFTADDDLDLKYVVSPDVEESSFNLDVEAGPNTPGEDWKDVNGFGIDNYLGKYAGGSFYIKDGVVVNAAMKSAKVANVSPEGEVEMISAEDSRADLDAREKANVFVREGDLMGNIGKGLDYEETLDKIKDYADRLLGADVEDVEDLMDFYLDNPSDLPEPLEYNFFKNNYDDILYYATTGKDELGEGKVETKSNKMKKSELKEMIKAAMLAEYEKNVNITDENPESEEDFLSEYDVEENIHNFDSDIEGKINKNDFAVWYRTGARGEAQALKAQELLQQNGIDADYSNGPYFINFSNSGVEQRVVHQMLRDAGLDNFVIANVSEGQLSEYGRSEFAQKLKDRADKEDLDDAFDRIDKEPDVYPGEKTLDPDYVKEADEEEEVDTEVDAEVDVDAEAGAEEGGEEVDVEASEEEEIDVKEKAKVDPNVKAVQDALTIAQAAAAELGDAKLTDQIGNTITFFTRSHVAAVDKGAMAEELNVNEITFPMWTKLKK